MEELTVGFSLCAEQQGQSPFHYMRTRDVGSLLAEGLSSPEELKHC